MHNKKHATALVEKSPVRDMYALALILSAAALLAAAKMAHRNRKPLGRDVARLLGVTVFPILGNLLLLFAKSVGEAQTAYFLFLAGTDLMFLYLIRFVVNSCHFHGRYEGVHRVLVCITAVDVAQIALNPVFGHAYRAERIVLPDGGIYFELLSGTGYVLHMLLACVYLAVIFIALAVKIFRKPMLYAEKYLIVFGAILLTTIWQFVSIFSHWQMDTSMIGYAVCGLIIFYFSLYYKPAFLLQRMMHYIVSSLSNAIFFFDLDGHCVYANQSALEIAGAADELQVEEKVPALRGLLGFTREDLFHDFERDMKTEEEQGRFYHVEYHVLKDRRGKNTGVFFSIQDRSEEERRTRRELYRANHDLMTGLYNRDGFCEQVRELLDRVAKEGRSTEDDAGFRIVVTNICNFKMINELFGKNKGDYVLQEFVRMLKENARDGSILARLGGDRFGIFCRSDGCDEANLEKSLYTITHILGKEAFPIITHVGIYEITEPELAVTLMIDRATMACSSIRGEYNRRIAYYDSNLRSSLLWEQKVVGELDAAIESGQIVPYLQAQVNQKGEMEGAEVLIRWQHPTEGLLSPGSFLPILERNGQIAQADCCIWEKACRILARWKKEGRDKLYLSINISPKDFYFMDVYEKLTSLVEQYGISPQNLRLEITETVMMEDMDRRLLLIEKLQKYGFLVEMDDFGSGYSSLNMLKDIPVDVLKIDMMFLYKTKNPEKARKILKMVIAMTEQLGIGSITEGVETREQAEMLHSMGCNMFQGYYFSKPISLEEFEGKYLADRQPVA